MLITHAIWQLCAEAAEFLVESLGPLGSPSAAAAAAPFSPALHKTLVALLALCTQPSFVEHARRDEPLIVRAPRQLPPVHSLWERVERLRPESSTGTGY
eukprot:COSAG01_NODE_2725_length_7180_cov_2.210705_4_plen_99_part_00